MLMVKLPFASVFTRLTSGRPSVTLDTTTSAPTAGLLVVLLSTLPVTGAAIAVALRAASASTNLIIRFLLLSEGGDLGEHGGGFAFERCAHRLKILLGELAGFVFEAEVAQVFVDGVAALLEVLQPRLVFAGARACVCRLEHVDESAHQQQRAGKNRHSSVSRRACSANSDRCSARTSWESRRDCIRAAPDCSRRCT